MAWSRNPAIDAELPWRRECFVISAVVFLALALRLYQIGTENLWNDEWLSLGDADQLRFYNRHRPLFFLVLHPWCRFLSVAGLLQAGDGWVRLLAVFFGIAAVVFFYLLARRLAGAAVALVASLIMVVAVPELDHSQEVRMYTMASALTLASFYLLVHWIDSGRFGLLALHLLLTLLAVLTTPTVIGGLLLAGVIATDPIDDGETVTLAELETPPTLAVTLTGPAARADNSPFEPAALLMEATVPSDVVQVAVVVRS